MSRNSNTVVRSRLSFTAILAILLTLSSCSSEPVDPTIANVSGVVTLGGRPIENATIMFQSDNSNRPSVATTDANGVYTLYYSASIPGAKIGDHKVTIRTSTDKEDGASTPELVPKKYFTKEGQLTAKVEPGNNTLNFDLESK